MSKSITRNSNPKVIIRARKKRRTKGKIYGTAECPRLSVFRSAHHLHVQVINDDEKRTLAAASSIDKAFKGKPVARKESPLKIAELLANRLNEKKIQRVVFDRNGFLYHGRIKALADALREKGIKF
ncbi:MAG TPA: 50S ribosomal protein L18 [Bdellovibrionota bacterium]|nr:50S ribosomal protein L18 [Bdellovibrionota bacterium]